MLGVEDERGMHRAHPAGTRGLPVQHVQEMAAGGFIVRFDLDPPPVSREVMPVAEH